LHECKAIALQFQGRPDEAIASYRRAIELQPDNSTWHSNLLYVLNFLPGYDAATMLAEHLAWAQRHAEPLTRRAAPHANDPHPDRRLRVGYVSPHFCQHAVNFFTEPMLLAHDHQHFEIVCYSSVATPDAITARIKSSVDQWRDVGPETDERLAEIVRDDQIDILVDLTGHIGNRRLLTFARKPAPIQVTYIGYQNTTGMSAMDYRLTDERSDPTGLTDPYYTEKLVRLPRSFFCYQPAVEAEPVSPLPALSAGYVTFGSLNDFTKVSPQALST
jgi:protein O-GlcNAc transferase